MIFDSLIFKENDSFYIDVTDLADDLSVEINDRIRFTYEGKRYVGKIESERGAFSKIYSIVLVK
jgi:hypothetical protein